MIAAFQALDEECRAPLVLFYLEEFSNREIASILGIPIDTFTSRVARGKNVLRKRIEAAEAEGLFRQIGYATQPGESDSLARTSGAR